MSNEKVPPHIRALKIGAQAVGALAVGALAIGALSIGALAIGRLVIGRSRIRRLEIDELVVARVHVTDSLTVPSTPAIENDLAKKQESEHFSPPTTLDRAFNKLFGLLVGLGLGLPHNYLLQVRGRKSGRVYSTPVDVLSRDGKRYLVAPRGYTQWVRNAVASGTVSLKKGRRSEQFSIRILSDDEKPEILKSYLDRYKLTVQRYFPVPARLSDRSLSAIDRTVPDLRADTPTMNWAVLALRKAVPFDMSFKTTVTNDGYSFKVHSIYTQQIDAVGDNFC
jgi:deazaflavin-dependent oxidoreductase (nitroreductase family)